MGSHPINLGIRFLLELAALGIAATWGWKQNDSWLKWILAIGLPLLLAAAWGTFAVVDDPSRSGNAPIPVHGIFRLALELSIFAFAGWALFSLGSTKLCQVFSIVVVVHYLISYDRVWWLISK